MCIDERKCAMTKGCFAVMNFEEMKKEETPLSKWYVKQGEVVVMWWKVS